ncbi:hypothetical protein GGR53DRAFT_469727 [Hypoxylon sp. FL1150]|nr:hypothetical protein GGR53DRAFT_469727 [Hypoxylon sp. FL1150]
MPFFYSKNFGGRHFGTNVTAGRHGVHRGPWRFSFRGFNCFKSYRIAQAQTAPLEQPASQADPVHTEQPVLSQQQQPQAQNLTAQVRPPPMQQSVFPQQQPQAQTPAGQVKGLTYTSPLDTIW